MHHNNFVHSEKDVSPVNCLIIHMFMQVYVFQDCIPCVQLSDMTVTFKEIWVSLFIFKSLPVTFFHTTDAQRQLFKKSK